MDSLRIRILRPLLTASLLVWMLGLTAGLVHPLRVAHVECPEHGELIELKGDGVAVAAPSEAGPSVSKAGGPEVHDDGCMLGAAHLVAATLVPSPAWQAASLDFPVQVVVITEGAPRGPPLAYAPKTSPPALA